MNNVKELELVGEPKKAPYQLDLITPITFEGRTFIPLVELAKIHFGNMYGDLTFNIEKSTNGGFVHITRKYSRMDFAFSNHTSEGSLRLQLNEKDVIVDQLKMFSYLHKWGFDIFWKTPEDLKINKKETISTFYIILYSLLAYSGIFMAFSSLMFLTQEPEGDKWFSRLALSLVCFGFLLVSSKLKKK